MDKYIQLDWDENDITNQLLQYIENNQFRSKNPSIVVNFDHPVPNTSIKKTKGYAAKEPRIDLRFVTFNFEVEYILFFEAKNLKEKNSALKRRYICTGIGNFVTRKYPKGFLVGYLLEGTVYPTIAGINNLLKIYKRENECLYSKKHDIVQFYYESNHSKIGTLKHLIFDFTVL